MTNELKVGDVVRVECKCSNCMRFGPPDPGEHNGPYIIREIHKDGLIVARAPFGVWRTWKRDDMVFLQVVGRAES